MPRPRSQNRNAGVLAALDRLAGAERAFVGQHLLAPVLRRGQVLVRLAGARCALRVAPRDFVGWGVFEATSFRDARLLQPATLAERGRFLRLLPGLSLVLVRRESQGWRAVPAQRSDSRFRIDGAVPVELVDDVDRFDTVRARFDGGRFWFEETDPRADPAAARYLREALGRDAPPADMARPGLTLEQRLAYATEVGWRLEDARARRQAEQLREAAEAEARTTAQERRVRDALAHAGANLRDLVERGDVYRVTYEVDGRRHTSVVNRHDLTVQTAGICLSGHDNHFDLASLVGVLREGEQKNRIVPMGLYDDE
jgi:hypothetical protein